MLFKSNVNINLEKTYLTGYDLTMLIPGLGNVYTFQYYEESLTEIVNAMKVNLELKKPVMEKHFDFSVNYTYEVPVVGKEYSSVKRNEALPSFVNNTITYLENWASTRNIVVNRNYITDGMDGFDSTKDGIIISQNIEKGTLVSTIDTLNVDVIKVEIKDDIIDNTDNVGEEIIEDITNIQDENDEINSDDNSNLDDDIIDDTLDDIINVE